MNSGKALLGILGGLAVGATLGILYAPEKGAFTRMKINKKKEHYTDEMSDKFNDFIDGITKKYEAMCNDFSRMVENGKAKIDGSKAEVVAAAK